MTQYEQVRERATNERGRWMRASAVSALLGGVAWTAAGLALFTTLTPAEFTYVDALGTVAIALLAVGLVAYYDSEHRRFGRTGTVGFGLLAAGTLLAAVGLPLAAYGPEAAFFGFLLGLLVQLLGALVLGVSMLRSGTDSRLAAALLAAALPVGLPVTLAYMQFVNEASAPWAGPILLYGLAWVVIGNALRTRDSGSERTPTTPE